MQVIRSITRLSSFLVGRMCELKIPQGLRAPIFRAYANLVGADFCLIDQPLNSHQTFQSFFLRALRSDARPIGLGLVSPVDGTVSEVGKVEQGKILQVKNRSYQLAELLCDGSLAASFEGGQYCSFYLSPADYHRVHSPVRGSLVELRNIPGRLLPVNGLTVSSLDRVLSRNERVIFRFDLEKYGSVLLVMVGALHVGSIAVTHANLVTNPALSTVFDLPPPSFQFLNPKADIQPGEEIGRFRMGSSVVLIFSPETGARLDIESRQKITYGRPIGEQVL